MIGMNLVERCTLLHRMMPDIRIKKTTLARIYKEYKIKNKLVRKIKVVPDQSKDKVEEAIIHGRERIN